ncbi:hypothetical protein HMPREF0044_0664 [Gleimia coleocanis DSM 15436]|uniref:Tat pathway signal sequence domain protein n=1 Tax=Gleimia coleocanis DSM 15436 TaxID=525245 RepID=C0W0S1_9ACTO|nr:hypothetical protein [Gleimia coleocanis]EEH63645.1 hypothetical protein HMPREF0044_0664 [Gleimia coleocanis DSM 15436]
MVFLAFGFGILCAIGALYLRRDTPGSRAWQGQNGMIDERFAFLFLPAFAMALLGLGLVSAGGLSRSIPWLFWTLTVIGLPFAVVGLGGALVGLFGKTAPAWLLPRWYKNQRKH